MKIRSSAVCLSTVLFMLVGSFTSYSQDVLFAGYDDDSGTAKKDPRADKVITSLSGHSGGRNCESSLWGTFDLDPRASADAGIASKVIPSLTLTIENTFNETNLDLRALHVQSLREKYKACKRAVFTYVSGDLDDTAGTIIGSFDITGINQWNARDLSFSDGLSDVQLAPGERATFRLTYDNNVGNHFTHVDNLAISGTLISPKSTIVQWGRSGGDSGIVTAKKKNSSVFKGTYNPSTVISPEVGSGYYPNNSERSPVFYGACSFNSSDLIINNQSAGDFIELTPTIDSGETYSAMLVWQDLLDECITLDTLSIDLENRYWDTDSHFRWLVQKETGEWYAGPKRKFQKYTDTAALLPWYAFTPFANGTASVDQMKAEIDLKNIVAVGFYMESKNMNKNRHVVGASMKYFQATSTETLSSEKSGFKSFDTGYTIMQVRNGISDGKSLIVGASYEGTVLAMDYDGNVLWTNPLTGYMVRDMWCDDLNDDGTDEILVAVSDGSVHCLSLIDGSAFWTQPFQLNEAPMNAVCTIRTSSTSKYIVCGGFDLNIYYLDIDGNLIETIDSRTYSDLQPWGGGKYYLDRKIDKSHSANFLRPWPQTDGTDLLIVDGTQIKLSSRMYIFEPLATLPINTYSNGLSDTTAALEVSDPDGDGNYTVFAGVSGMSILVAERDFTADTTMTYKADLTDPKTYRISHLTHIPSDGGYKNLVLCGHQITLLDSDLATGKETIMMPYGFNDLWRDRSNGRVLLASTQDGGSAIHIIDPAIPNWKRLIQDVDPPGKIQGIKKNFAAVRNFNKSFSKPSWERAPDQIISVGGATSYGKELAVKSGTPKFLSGIHSTKVQRTDWKEGLTADEPYLWSVDKRFDHVLTQQQVLDEYIQPAIDQYQNGFQFRGGHGNAPYYYQPETLIKAIDRCYASDPEKVIVMNWAELQSTSDSMSYLLDRMLMPVAEHMEKRNGILSFNNKHLFYGSTIHKPIWNDFISGKMKHVFRSSMEESTSKTPELSLSARIGLWASGCFDGWGARTTRDNVSFDRSREYGSQMIANHFLRAMVYRMAYGADYTTCSYINLDHQGLANELVASGALYVPRREEVVSFSPVHIGIHSDMDPRYIAANEIPKWTTYYDEAEQAANPMVFGRFEGCWMAGKNTPWDFSTYAAGVKERRQNFLPPYPNGMVLTTPVENGIHASNADYRERLVHNLHPIYRNILKEHITDGKSYVGSDSDAKYPANGSYYEAVVRDIKSGAKLLPVSVTGDVAWVCAQTAPNHLRLTLIDSGYLNPEERVAHIRFNTVQPVGMTDLLSGEKLSVSGATADITVPLGMFRFIDIELDQQFGQSIVEQQISLKSGRNLISLYLDPVDRSLESIFADVLEKVEYVRDSEGHHLCRINGKWVNRIGPWNTERGYLVKMKDLVEPLKLSVYGYPVKEDKSILIPQGYSFLPYYPSDSMTADEVAAKIEETTSSPRGADGNELSGDSSLSRGDAFLIKTDKESSLNYTH